MEAALQNIYDAVVKGSQEDVRRYVLQALEEGIEPRTVLDEGLIAGMDRVGDLFDKNEFYVPDMMIAARAMKEGLEVLRPELTSMEFETAGRVVIGTVKGDLHDIGKNLVVIMLEGAGFKVEDLGINVPPEKFVQAISESQVDILALSALLTTTMVQMENTVKAIQEAGLGEKVKIIVGGAPVTDEFAREIGADGFAPDASKAVKLARSLLN